MYICEKRKKNATLQHSETANYAGKLLVQPWKKKSESELTNFDIFKSVIGITDIRVIGLDTTKYTPATTLCVCVCRLF